MENLEVLRAEEEWQRTGAYSVRIQGMNREHHISLREEFDEHDGEGTRYIVLLDDGYPIATCRFYPADEERAKVGLPKPVMDKDLLSTAGSTWAAGLSARPRNGSASAVSRKW